MLREVRWASPQSHFIHCSESGCSCAFALLSPLPPNTTHQTFIINDYPKGISCGTPPHSLLIHLSFQRVKMNTSLSINRKELCDCTITVCEKWQIDCLWILSQITFTLYFPFCLLWPCKHVISFQSHISFLFHHFCHFSSSKVDWHLSKNTQKPSFRPSKTGKSHKIANVGKREGLTK